MLETRERYVLTDFPLVADPAAPSLEVSMALCKVLPDGTTERPGPTPTWRQLPRVRVRHDTFPFALDSRMVHFFGVSQQAAECPFLLAYDAAGVLRFRIDREAGEFTAYEVPEEVNGRPELKPSVRVTFDDFEDAQAFLTLVEKLRAGVRPADADSLSRVLERSFSARFATVAQRP